MIDIPIYTPKIAKWAVHSKYTSRIDESRIYSNGGFNVVDLEARLANYLGVKETNVVAVVNATIALEGAFETSNLPGTWNCPSWTFAATPSALVRSRSDFEFTDVDSDWRIKLPLGNERLLVDVLPFGAKPRIEDYSADLRGVVIDAAASFDSIRSLEFGRYKSPLAFVTSFQATKSMPGAEGAIFFSTDIDWVQRMRRWINFGFGHDRESQLVGTNGKMHEYSAALVLTSLDSWANDRKDWVAQMEWAKGISQKFNLKSTQAFDKGYVSPYWIIRGHPLEISNIEKQFSHDRIQTRKWWGGGCHKMSAFRNIGKGDLSYTDTIEESYLGLPFFRELTDNEHNRIERSLEESFSI